MKAGSLVSILGAALGVSMVQPSSATTRPAMECYKERSAEARQDCAAPRAVEARPELHAVKKKAKKGGPPNPLPRPESVPTPPKGPPPAPPKAPPTQLPKPAPTAPLTK
jgi:hypothetical protein